MSWGSLRVIAVRLPEETGVIITQPIVRDADDGNIFMVRDVTSPHPVPNTLIDYQDIESGRIGPFLSIEERPAHMGFLSVIASPDFITALNHTNVPDIMRWENLKQGRRFGYASIEDIQRWRKHTADAFLSKAEEKLKEAIMQRSAGRYVPQSLFETIDLMLTQLGYITDGGSSERKRMYLLWCILFADDSTRWPVIEDLAMRELEVSAATLQEEMLLFRQQRLEGPKKRLFSFPPTRYQLLPTETRGASELELA